MKTSDIIQPGLPTLFTLQIEFLSNRVMNFAVDPSVRRWLEKSMVEAPCNIPGAECFLCFPSSSERVNFVRVSEIKRLKFGVNEIANENVYYDNFELYPYHTGGIVNVQSRTADAQLPSMILELQDSQRLIFSILDPELNSLDLNEVNLWQPFYFKAGFISVFGHEGDCDYIPATNVTFFEISASLVTPINQWVEADDS